MICGVFVQRIDWNGITLEISYEPNWLNTEKNGIPIAHLEIRSLHPEDAVLPVTDTGYRSHFVPASKVIDLGGPIGYVRTWLDKAAQSKEWKTYQERARQLSFF